MQSSFLNTWLDSVAARLEPVAFPAPFLHVTNEDGEDEDAHEPGGGHEQDLRYVVLRRLGVLPNRDGRLGRKVEAPGGQPNNINTIL